MSGICGICEPGRTLSPAGIEAMLAAFVLPEESAQQAPGADSVSLAVASRWYFQQVADIPGVRIAADAELLNRAELTNHLKSGNFDAARLTSAELIASGSTVCIGARKESASFLLRGREPFAAPRKRLRLSIRLRWCSTCYSALSPRRWRFIMASRSFALDFTSSMKPARFARLAIGTSSIVKVTIVASLTGRMKSAKGCAPPSIII